MRAAVHGHEDVMRQLIESGATLDLRDYYPSGRTALCWAAREGKLKCVKLLLDRKADAELVDCKDKTALDIAKEKN